MGFKQKYEVFVFFFKKTEKEREIMCERDLGARGIRQDGH